MRKIAMWGFAVWLIGLPAAYAADPIVVSAVSVEQPEEGGPPMAEVILNRAIKVREIKVIKTKTGTVLQYPEYVSRRGRRYPQVKMLTKEAADTVKQAILTGKPTPGGDKVRNISFRVESVFPLRSPTRKANAEVVFNDAVQVTLGVMKSRYGQDEYWIAYPARKDEASGRWLNHVQILNQRLKQAVEQKVISEYKAQVGGEGEGGYEEKEPEAANY